MLIEQPEHSGEKRGGPLEVLMLRRVDQLLGVGGGEAVLETGEHGSKLFLAEFQLFLEEFPGNRLAEREVLHDGHSFS